jgi:hypothetical protein
VGAQVQKRKAQRQESLWIAAHSLPIIQEHPFYRQLNEIFAEYGFDAYVDELTAPYYKKGGRRSIPVGNEDWEHPHDPDARVGRNKQKSTDMLYKLEKTDDLDTGAIVS